MVAVTRALTWILALLLLSPILQTAAGTNVVNLIWKAQNARVRLAVTQKDLLSEAAFERAVRNRLGIADQRIDIQLVDGNGGQLSVAKIVKLPPRQPVYVLSQMVNIGAGGQNEAAANTAVKAVKAEPIDCSSDLDSCLAPQTRGPLLFRQGVEMLTPRGTVVEHLELYRNEDPSATALAWCARYGVEEAECRKLEQVLVEHLKRRKVDEERWKSYDGLGFIEMLMW